MTQYLSLRREKSGVVTLGIVQPKDIESVRSSTKTIRLGAENGAYGKRLPEVNFTFELCLLRENRVVGCFGAIVSDGVIAPVEDDFPGSLTLIRERYSCTTIAYYGRLVIPNNQQSFREIAMVAAGALNLTAKLQAKAAVVIINPRHERPYKRFGFETIAEKDSITGVGLPGTLMVLPVSEGSSRKAPPVTFERQHNVETHHEIDPTPSAWMALEGRGSVPGEEPTEHP